MTRRRKRENTTEQPMSHDGTRKHDYPGKGNMHSSSYNLVFMKLKISQKIWFLVIHKWLHVSSVTSSKS